MRTAHLLRRLVERALGEMREAEEEGGGRSKAKRGEGRKREREKYVSKGEEGVKGPDDGPRELHLKVPAEAHGKEN